MYSHCRGIIVSAQWHCLHRPCRIRHSCRLVLPSQMAWVRPGMARAGIRRESSAASSPRHRPRRRCPPLSGRGGGASWPRERRRRPSATSAPSCFQCSPCGGGPSSAPTAVAWPSARVATADPKKAEACKEWTTHAAQHDCDQRACRRRRRRYRERGQEWGRDHAAPLVCPAHERAQSRGGRPTRTDQTRRSLPSPASATTANVRAYFTVRN